MGQTTAPQQTEKNPRTFNTGMIIKVAAIVLVTLAIYLIPPPDGVDPRGMHMAAIFVGTILGLILQPLPTAAVAIIGLAAAMITGTMDAKTEALQGFGDSTIWLIVAAFFIADGFLITGLGKRIALIFVRILGKSSLGLSYGMTITDLILAPATPSNTARAGGVVYPIIKSLASLNNSEPTSDESRRRLGSYLSLTAVQVNTITSAMFITAMAGNPVAVKFAREMEIDISWGTWALAAVVPGVAALALMPWAMSKVYPPTLKETPQAPEHARQELSGMGPMSSKEWIMLITFLLLLILWICSEFTGISATASAFLGIAILLCTGVITWKDMAANSGAWSTLIFFSVLVGMANHLNELGVIGWIGDSAAETVGGLSWPIALIALLLVYFYVHYFFASNTAQIVAMYSVFLGTTIAAGAPPLLAALVFGFAGNLIGGLTHYASGPAGVIYGSGYVKTTEWFRVGFLASIVNLMVWGVVGGLWWMILGYF